MLASPIGRNPLSRCGLVLSRANQLPEIDPEGIPFGEDGLLTGEELCDLDLHGIRLVVLSACETALGQVADSEGVFGLHQALSRAGVDATIGSLWQVSDDGTTLLMSEFYRHLLTGKENAATALRNAQLALLKGEVGQSVFATPYYWAAFVLSGNADVTLEPTSTESPP